MNVADVLKQIEGRLKYFEDRYAWNKNVKYSQVTGDKISQSMKEYWRRRKAQETK